MNFKREEHGNPAVYQNYEKTKRRLVMLRIQGRHSNKKRKRVVDRNIRNGFRVRNKKGIKESKEKKTFRAEKSIKISSENTTRDTVGSKS